MVWWGVFIGSESNHNLNLIVNYNSKMTLLTNGYVGIGTTSPTELLAVNGTLRIRNLSQDNSQNRLLVSDTNGKIYWKDTPVVAGDNLGNHIATQPILGNTNNTIDLGSASLSFRDVYFGGKFFFQGAQMFSVSGDYVNALENIFLGRNSGTSNTTG